MSRAILLSGGLDSIALAYLTKPNVAFTIDYGQRPAEKEIEVSGKVCEILGIKHELVSVDCSHLGSGDLSTNSSIGISPSTEWWPFRNQLLVTLACMKGITMGITELLLGSVKTDGFHKDGTTEFYDKLNQLITYQEGHIAIHCPGIEFTSSELIKNSDVPLDIILWAHSCHTSNIACGVCPGCLKHLRVKQDLGI